MDCVKGRTINIVDRNLKHFEKVKNDRNIHETVLELKLFLYYIVEYRQGQRGPNSVNVTNRIKETNEYEMIVYLFYC